MQQAKRDNVTNAWKIASVLYKQKAGYVEITNELANQGYSRNVISRALGILTAGGFEEA